MKKNAFLVISIAMTLFGGTDTVVLVNGTTLTGSVKNFGSLLAKKSEKVCFSDENHVLSFYNLLEIASIRKDTSEYSCIRGNLQLKGTESFEDFAFPTTPRKSGAYLSYNDFVGNKPLNLGDSLVVSPSQLSNLSYSNDIGHLEGSYYHVSERKTGKAISWKKKFKQKIWAYVDEQRTYKCFDGLLSPVVQIDSLIWCFVPKLNYASTGNSMLGAVLGSVAEVVDDGYNVSGGGYLIEDVQLLDSKTGNEYYIDPISLSKLLETFPDLQKIYSKLSPNDQIIQQSRFFMKYAERIREESIQNMQEKKPEPIDLGFE